MPSTSLPPHIPRYCRNCGVAVEFIEHHEDDAGKQHHVRWVCPGCGHDGGVGWATMESASSSRLGRVTMPSSRLGRIIAALKHQLVAWHFHPPRAGRRGRHAHEQAMRQIQDQGSAALLRMVDFPLFVLARAAPRLRPLGRSFGSDGPPKRGTPLRLSCVGVAYAGPQYEDVTECIELAQTDAELRPHESTRSWPFEALGRFGGVAHTGPASLRALANGGEIHRWVNAAALEQAPLSRPVIRIPSGEALQWELGRVALPTPMAMARTRYGRTLLTVTAAGPVAGELEAWLGRLARLHPLSRESGELDAGLRAAEEYFRQRYS